VAAVTAPGRANYLEEEDAAGRVEEVVTSPWRGSAKTTLSPKCPDNGPPNNEGTETEKHGCWRYHDANHRDGDDSIKNLDDMKRLT
jgi:hypothetical protein